jgi:NADH-quinone oxidoreductase subunit E
MLSEEETREVLKEIGENEHSRAACLGALKIVQRHRRWVSDQGIRDIAPLLAMTPSELDAVATFYPFIYRKPVGRHVILVCDSISCWIMGYEPVREELTRRLGIAAGQTTADDRFTILPVSCIGACDHAPAMMIDGDLHGDLTVEHLGAILNSYK